MKQTQRIIKTGDYYELEVNDQILSYQKFLKKEDVGPSPSQTQPPENIITKIPTHHQAKLSYFVPKQIKQNQNQGLNHYQQSLQELLKQPLKDEEVLEINKLLQQIDQVKNYGEIPLNQLPKKQPYQPKKQKHQPPSSISLQTQYSLGHIEKDLENLQTLSISDTCRLQMMLQILLGEHKLQSTPNSQIDEKIREQVEAVYAHMKKLTSLNNMQNIVERVSSNQTKFLQMKQWSEKTQFISNLNNNFKNELESDELIVKELESMFKENLKAVRSIISKIKE